MIETKEKIIAGSSYSVTQLPARRALRLKAKLLKIFGAPLAQLMISDDPKKPFISVNSEGHQDINIYKDDVVKALPMLFANLDEKTFEQLVLELMQGVRKDGMELSEGLIDSEFAGELNVFLKVLWFVIEVNFGSFFSGGDIGSVSLVRSNQAPIHTKKTSIKT